MEVLDRLVAGDIYTFGVTVPEGLTLVEIAEHLAGHGVGDAEKLEDAFRNATLIAKLDHDAPNLEGYLFPTRYQFTRHATAAEVARAMVGQFNAVFDDDKRNKAKELGLTVREVVALASIIEKETGSADERPLIGSVVWNRLERGMALGMDSTIIYALKLQGTYDGNIRRVDLEIKSPYNTYRAVGIPPGPHRLTGRSGHRCRARARGLFLSLLRFEKRRDPSFLEELSRARERRAQIPSGVLPTETTSEKRSRFFVTSRRALRACLLALAYLTLALVFTYPLASHFGTHHVGEAGGDAKTYLWNYWWVEKALFDLGTSPFETEHIFYPVGIGLSLHTLASLQGVLVAPLEKLVDRSEPRTSSSSGHSSLRRSRPTRSRVAWEPAGKVPFSPASRSRFARIGSRASQDITTSLEQSGSRSMSCC